MQEAGYKKEEKHGLLEEVSKKLIEGETPIAATVFTRKANEVDLELTKIANKYLEQKMAVTQPVRHLGDLRGPAWVLCL